MRKSPFFKQSGKVENRWNEKRAWRRQEARLNRWWIGTGLGLFLVTFLVLQMCFTRVCAPTGSVGWPIQTLLALAATWLVIVTTRKISLCCARA